ncbi:MAG: hypothetical protein GDA49_07070 [Rhodospirillales bacterium]|nr:hypothetical protein [Rhodospirillales bacterium]
MARRLFPTDRPPRFLGPTPDAPVGGTLNLAKVGTFDSVNPYIVLGIPARGLGLVYQTLMYRSPVLILIGDADNWTPANLCVALTERVSESSAPVELVVYKGATAPTTGTDWSMTRPPISTASNASGPFPSLQQA